MQAERFSENDTRRIMLTDVDFQRLVRGGIVRVEVGGFTRPVHIAISLKDIVFDQMHLLIEEAEGLR